MAKEFTNENVTLEVAVRANASDEPEPLMDSRFK
jgi:hypothetical protein